MVDMLMLTLAMEVLLKVEKVLVSGNNGKSERKRRLLLDGPSTRPPSLPLTTQEHGTAHSYKEGT